MFFHIPSDSGVKEREKKIDNPTSEWTHKNEELEE
jgi:hypothetical protein